MTDAELRQALEPVREHFSGREVSVNTVLAAHLRARRPARLRPAVGAAPRRHGVRGGTSPRRSPLPWRYRSGHRGGTPRRDAAGSPERRAHGSRRERALDWFPKQFGPGDIDGVGAQRLLGTPTIDPAWVLVRETAQNSWDARGARRPPSTSPSTCAALDDGNRDTCCGSGSSPGTHPAPAWPSCSTGTRSGPWRSSDRGTVGLAGPDPQRPRGGPGEDTNFIDLVFNIGAPRDVHLGGGTYGFGKTIAYVTSGVGTVLIWSRCEGPRRVGAPADRLGHRRRLRPRRPPLHRAALVGHRRPR